MFQRMSVSVITNKKSSKKESNATGCNTKTRNALNLIDRLCHK